jgi:hypothetical protein
MEVSENGIDYTRTNQAYRDFMKRYFGFDLSERSGGYSAEPSGMAVSFMELVHQCCADGNRVVYDGRLSDGSMAHVIIKRIGVNPVTGVTAVAVSVLSVADADEITTFADIARALAADYYDIYVVDLNTDRFIEYNAVVGEDELDVERHGEQFFASARQAALTRIHEADREAFLSVFTRENIIRELAEQNVFTLTYRLIDTGTPIHVSMKITGAVGGKRIVIGISNIDAQMKQQEYLKGVRYERDALARVMALSEDYLSLYTVDPDTGHYVLYNATAAYESLGFAREGADFFTQGIVDGKRTICPDDLPLYLERFRKDTILKEIRENGVFKLHYRLMFGDEAKPVSLRIAMLKEGEGGKLAAGVRAWRDRRT